MTGRDILVFLFKWKGTLLLVFATVFGVATALAYLIPPSYRATATVLVEINRSPVQRSAFVPAVDVQEVMATEAEIVSSRTVMEAVVERLKLHERVAPDSALKRFRDAVTAQLVEAGLIQTMPARERWISSLQTSVDPKLVTSSSVINIRYTDEEPKQAAEIANAVMEAYIAHHLRIFSPNEASELYRRQMAASDAELTRLRRQLLEEKRRASVAAIDENRKSLVQASTALREQRVEALTELNGLKARYHPDHEKVKLAADKVGRIEAFLADSARQLQNLERAESNLKETELAIASEEQTFREHKRRYDDAKLSEGADVNHVNVRVVDYAAVPARPVYSRLFLIVVAIGAGLMAALSIAFVREYFDRRVLSPQLAEQLLGIPELGSIPTLRRPLRER